MNGISKESYLKATPKLKDEMLFDLLLGVHLKVDKITTNCPVQKKECEQQFAPIKTVNRLWAYVLGLPALLGAILLTISLVGK